MAKKSARYSDAASIVGEELAADLEAKSQQLIGRSGGMDPAAIILKDAAGFPPGEEETEEMPPTGTAEEEESSEEAPPFGERAYGGAVTLNQAEAFLVREKGEGVLLGDWGILAGVLTNMAPEKGQAIAKELKEFQSRIDVMALKALANLQKREEPMSEKEVVVTPEVEAVATPHPLEVAFGSLREAFDQALATPLDGVSRRKMIQPALNQLGEVIVARVDESNPQPASSEASVLTLEQLTMAVQAAVAPLHAEIAALKERSVVGNGLLNIPTPRAARGIAEGTRLSYAGPVPGETLRMANEVAEASAPDGFGYHHPGRINALNDSSPATETPKLSAMIRRSVGLRS